MTQYPYTLLITVGSTLFPSLTSSILSPPVLTLLSSLGVTTLIVQYGKAVLPKGMTEQLSVGVNGEGSAMMEGLEVRVMRYTEDFEGLVKSADGVVSHAGSGSILTVLRQIPPKPLLVVPNESLMDNHQTELADALGKDDYLLVSRLTDLEESLKEFLGGWKERQRKFPGRGEGFAVVVDELMGFS